MKEHFNGVNRMYEGHREMNPAGLGLKPVNRQSAPGAEGSAAEGLQEEAFLLDPQGGYSRRMEEIDLKGDSAMAGMDSQTALESSVWIRRQAGESLGREAMGRAHYAVNPGMLAGMFNGS